MPDGKIDEFVASTVAEHLQNGTKARNKAYNACNYNVDVEGYIGKTAMLLF